MLNIRSDIKHDEEIKFSWIYPEKANEKLGVRIIFLGIDFTFSNISINQHSQFVYDVDATIPKKYSNIPQSQLLEIAHEALLKFWEAEAKPANNLYN